MCRAVLKYKISQTQIPTRRDQGLGERNCEMLLVSLETMPLLTLLISEIYFARKDFNLHISVPQRRQNLPSAESAAAVNQLL